MYMYLYIYIYIYVYIYLTLNSGTNNKYVLQLKILYSTITRYSIITTYLMIVEHETLSYKT